MKVGIIVHSHTGNTYSVALRLKEELEKGGHIVSLDKVTAINDDQREVGKIKLENAPEIAVYDALIFGAPVRGFSLSPVMAAYLSQLQTHSGKKTACFLTQFFPHPSMGGSRSMEQMKEICDSQGMGVYETGIINWSNINRRRKIREVVEKFSNCLSTSAQEENI